MKVGDTEVVMWLEASGGRSYCLTISSKRMGKRDSKQWLKPVFQWFVEEWLSDEGANRHTTMKTEKTLEAAMRHARRQADKMEQETRKKRG